MMAKKPLYFFLLKTALRPVLLKLLISTSGTSIYMATDLEQRLGKGFLFKKREFETYSIIFTLVKLYKCYSSH